MQWVQDYATKDRMYGICISPGEDIVRNHAMQVGFPATQVASI